MVRVLLHEDLYLSAVQKSATLSGSVTPALRVILVVLA